MKTKSVLMLVLIVFAFAKVQSQELPPKHRGMHPILKSDGSVVDESGKELGPIKDGKVCDVTGKVIGVISGSWRCDGCQWKKYREDSKRWKLLNL